MYMHAQLMSSSCVGKALSLSVEVHEINVLNLTVFFCIISSPKLASHGACCLWQLLYPMIKKV